MTSRLRHKVHINVTEADIAGAIRNASKHCAVATGVKHSLDGIVRPQVDIQTIRFSDALTGTRYIYLTPPIVADYIVAFDAGDEIKPFEFDLITPAYVGKMRRNLDVGDNGPDYNAVIFMPRDNDSTLSDGATERTVAVHKKDVPPLIKDREYGRRKLRVNQAKGGRNSA